MSVIDKRLQDFAGRLLDDTEMVDAVRERVQNSLFMRFRKATPQEREIINAIMDNEQLFWAEIGAIAGEAEQVNEEQEKQKTKK